MNEYQIEQAAKAQIYQNQIKAIAKALGRPIVSRPGDVGDRFATIDLGEGRSIHFGKDWNKNRVEVSGNFPRNAKGESFHPQSYDKSPYTPISISLDRAPEAIAKDIYPPAYSGLYRGICQAA